MVDGSSADLRRLARLYADIAFFRRGPEDVPFSQRAFAVTLLAYGLLGLVFNAALPVSTGNYGALILLDSLLGLAWYWVVLKLARRPERFLQTACAVFGFQAVLQPGFSLATWLFLRYMKDPVWQAPASLLLLALALWTLAVTARILRSATGWSQFASVSMVLLQALVIRALELAILPGTTAA